MNTKGITLDKVTRAFLKKAARFFLEHPLVPCPKSHINAPTEKQRAFARKNWGFEVGLIGKDEEIADGFLADLKSGSTYTEGYRYGVLGWPHTKLRFTVNDKGMFRFYIHANTDSLHTKDVLKKCRAIARDMTKAGFPTWTGR